MTTIDFRSITPVYPGVRRPRRAPAPTRPEAPASVAVPAVHRPSVAQRLLSLLGTLFLVVAVAAVLFLAIGPRFLGYQTATMLTGSMAPGINPGDVVVTTVQPVDEVAVGDIISYHIPVEDHRVETHRVIDVIHGENGITSVRTKGDANPAEDPWIATLDGDHVYEVEAVIPAVGNAIRALRTPLVSHILVYGVPAVLVGGMLMMIWGRPKEDGEAEQGPDQGSTTGDGRPGSAATHRDGLPQLPVLDRPVLDRLADELASPAGALRFATTFAELVPERIDAIEEAFRSGDTDAAVVAVLSLNVSSSMVGACRLEEYSSVALDLIDDPASYAPLVDRLRVLGSEFQSELGGIIR